MFKNLTLLDIVNSVIRSFEKDLCEFNYRNLNSNIDLDNFGLVSNEQALNILSANLLEYVHAIPNVETFDLTKCYRFNVAIAENDNHKVITITGVKYKDKECEAFDLYSLIFITVNDNLESFKLELSYKDKKDEQKLSFRFMVRTNGEISLEFFNNVLARRILLNNILEAMSSVTNFEFNKQLVFALGGCITHTKEL